jgi:hypothetical protein
MTLAQPGGAAGVGITGIYTNATGNSGTVAGSFDGATFTGDITPTPGTATASNCPAKLVLFFSYKSLTGTSLTYNCAATTTLQVALAKQ